MKHTLGRGRMGLAAAAVVLVFPCGLAAQSFKVEKVNIGGEGGHDYISVDPASGRVFVSRGTHVMVVDPSGKVLGDIANTPRVHGVAFATKHNHGFTTNGGDSTSTMFDLKTLQELKRVHAGINGLDGIMYDETTEKILTINHSNPGTAVVIDAKSGDVVSTITLSGTAPEGGAADGKGRIFINIEDKNAIDVVDTKTWTVTATWPITPCEGPTGIAYDRKTNRIFSGCSKKSVVVDAASGKVVAQLDNGDGVDAIGWDAAQKLIYIPAGRSGNVTVVRQDSPDKYTTVATVPTMTGAKTIVVDESKHVAYAVALEYGPAPAPTAGATPPAQGRGRGPARGPVVGAWFMTIHQ
jgi:DNA-binding beta-propeller fold protein YncE